VNTSTRRSSLLVLAPLPAVCVGLWILRADGAGPIVLISNLCAALAGALFVALAPAARARPALGLAVGAMAAALAFPGMEGVRRWIPVGPLSLHAGALVGPLVVAGAAAGGAGGPLALAAIGIAVVQPDAALATQLAVALVVLGVARSGTERARSLVFGLLACAGAAAAWLRPDPLLPLPRVEGIVELAFERGALVGALAIATLAVAPLASVRAARFGPSATLPLALAAYLATGVLVTRFGAFPVPLLGQGVSPILGTFAAMWLAGGVTRDGSPSA